MPTPSLKIASNANHVDALDLRDNRAFWRGVQVDLTVREFKIVDHLASRPGIDRTYRQIYDVVRGKDFISGYEGDGHRNAVRSFIKRIRKKFRAMDLEFDQIKNYDSFGYRWKVE